MNELLNSSFTSSLAIALFHSIWQAGILFILLKFFESILHKSGSNFKYGLAFGTLCLFILINFISFGTLISENYSSTVEMTGVWSNLKLGELSNTGLSTKVNSYNLISLIPYFIIFWWFGLVFFTLRFSINLYRTHQLAKNGLIEPSHSVQSVFKSVIRRLRMSEKIKIYFSDKVLSPAVIGAIKPVVLLPIGLVNGLSTDEVEAILIHELNHIRRHDYMVNLLQSVVEIIYFFNPFVWLISREIREQRENACDDKAIAMGVSRRSYAEILANIYEHAYNNNNLAVSFADRKNLTLKRIRRIMKTQSNNNKVFTSLFLVTAISLAIYVGAEAPLPSDNIPFYSPERIEIASPLGSFRMDNPAKLIEDLKHRLDQPVKVEVPVMAIDTIDEKEIEKKAQEYEKAMERLHSTREWQELETLRKEMFEEQMELMKELTPQIEEAMEAVEWTIKLEEVELEELREKMAQVKFEMNEIELNEEMARAMELSTKAIQESMAQVEAEMERITAVEMEALAQEYSVMAKKYAIEAEEMAKEAEKAVLEAQKIVERFESFMKELKSDLISDGYLKKGEDLDDLRFDDGKVFVNDKEVKSSDAKKYYELRKKHLGDDSDFSWN